jgi:tetratricopeptide (TPR) repeat protein
LQLSIRTTKAEQQRKYNSDAVKLIFNLQEISAMSTKTLLITSVLFVFLLSAAAGQCFADASTQFKQANDYKQNKQYEQAESIYQQIVTGFPGSDDALEAQKQLTLLYITTDSLEQADAALQQLLISFSGHKDIAQAVHDIAYQYRCVNKQQKANQIDQYVVNNWPQSDYAVLGQMDLAKYYVDCRDDPNADAAYDKLLAKFSTSPLIARAVHDVAQHYQALRKYNKANRLYQYVVEHWPETEHALWSQADLIKSYLAVKDEMAAQKAVDRLLADFTGNPLIARAVWDTGQLYRDLKKYKKANRLYLHVVDNWPGTEHAMWSQADLIKSYLALRDDPNAAVAVDKLLADFTDNPLIARAVWDTAHLYRGLKKYEKAKRLYQHIIDQWPEAEHAIQSQTDLVKVHLSLEEEGAAEAAVNKLLSDFDDNPLIARAIWDTGQFYRNLKKYDMANLLYQHVIDEWPESEHAMWAQADLIKSYISLADETKAEAATDKLLTDFNDSPLIARAVWDTGQLYRSLKKYDKANRLYRHVVENWPEPEHAMWAQADLIKSYLALKDDPNAEAAAGKLLTDFNDIPLIARAIWDTARLYRDLRKYEGSKQLYQHVIDDYPHTEHAILSQIGVAEVNVLSHIDSGNDSAAQAELDILIADFNDHPALPEAVFVIGEQYYNKAFRCKKERLYAESKKNFQKAIAVWERIITKLPPSPLIPQANIFVGICYDRIGEYSTAIKYYQVVLDDWPDYQHACSAQYKIGRCYQRLRDAGVLDKSEAEIMIRAAYEAVVKNYPGCSTIPAARNWLNYNKKSVEGGQK